MKNINYYRTNSKVIIEFSDNGIRISQEDLKFIFQPFFKATQTKIKYEKGSGLGLFLTKKIIEIHNGKIEVKSYTQIGSAFVVSLSV